MYVTIRLYKPTPHSPLSPERRLD